MYWHEMFGLYSRVWVFYLTILFDQHLGCFQFSALKIVGNLWTTSLSTQMFQSSRFPEVGFLGSVQLLSCVQLFVTPWTAARQASLSITNSRSLLKLMPIELVMPSNRLILCYPLLLLLSIFPSIRVFSKKSVFPIRWPKYWSFSISPSNEYSGLISFRRTGLILQSKGLSGVFSNTTV